MNKLKAMYGYWTHCMYSCDPDAFENYIKDNKTPPPSAKFDKYFNQIEPLIPSNSNFVNNLTLNERDNQNSSVLPNSNGDIKDLAEIWTVKPHPPYSAQVKNFGEILFFYHKKNYIPFNSIYIWALKELLQFQLFHDEFK